MDYPGKVITKTQVTPTQTSASGNWTLDDQAAAIKNNNWPVALVPNPISKSLRFNSADSAYLNRTPASASNRKTWTWSGWVKRGALGGINQLFAARTGSVLTYTLFYFDTTDTDKIKFLDDGGATLTSSSLYRDPSAWYHIILAVDTTQATSSNRVKIYVNGTQLTAFSTATYPSQNADLNVNSTATHLIGQQASGQYFDGYMTEVNFIDGQALTPSDFGLTNPQTGQWIPKKYTGTYGTNGFYLNFKDATSTTTLGYDYSGNANNWTTNNFSVTAGVGNDSLTDVPTPWVAYSTTGDSGGVVRGNYCTLNPLNVASAGVALSNGNLTATISGLSNYPCASTMAVSSGKWYFESTVTTAGGSYPFIGIIPSTNYLLGSTTSVAGYTNACWAGNGAFANGDICGFAFDLDGLTFTAYNNGVALGTSFYGNPSGGSNTITSGLTWVPAISGVNGAVFNMNFGQRPFAYTPPAGFRSLCTTNLPATTIGFGLTNQGDDYFNTVLYTGNGTTNAITGVGFQPDFVWLKSRSGATTNHALFDAVRGVGYNLRSNTTEAEAIPSPNDSLTAFNSDGFTLGANANSGAPNINFTVGGTYVGWNWKAGGTGVTNTAGSITSTVSANTTAGFSIVTYTGTGSNATVGHGLGVAPSMVIVKSRTGGTSSWAVWFTGFSGTEYILLESSAAKASAASVWNSTVPNSTVVSIGTGSVPNTNGWTYVMYCFAAVAGYSAFGSYTGNGSTDGPFIYTGFRPRYMLIKAASGGTGSWNIIDTARDPYNLSTKGLYADLADAEDSTRAIDILSNGFKIRSATATNASGVTYIYAAFAESPFQFANAR